MDIMNIKQKKKHTQRHKPDQSVLLKQQRWIKVKVKGNGSRTGGTA
ncbi:MAG: hypothetical protein QHH74_15735 [Spirochaetota bacterium]|nr:hypothetical protein [Spirochaetota bacterium]